MTETCRPDARRNAIGLETAGRLAEALKAVADPLRLRMLSAIATAPAGEACVCDLAELSDATQPTVSYHLRLLREAGIVESERRGTWVHYRIAPELRPAVGALLESFAPAAVAGAGREGPSGLADVDAVLDRLADDLADRHPEIEADTVLRIVRESYADLARSARVPTHLVGLTERFARQRLHDLARDLAHDRARDRAAAKPQVLFLCVANAGRSQLAAALLARYAGDRLVIRSAGSAPAADIHPAVRATLDELGAADAYPKPLTDDAVRAADVVVTMGCGDVCPILPGVRYEDWPLGDPALASPAGVAAIRDELDVRVRTLADELLPDLARTNGASHD